MGCGEWNVECKKNKLKMKFFKKINSLDLAVLLLMIKSKI